VSGLALDSVDNIVVSANVDSVTGHPFIAKLAP